MTDATPSLIERRLVRVTPAPPCDAERVRAIRRALNVSQGVFADLLNVGPQTVRNWEQGLRSPDGAAERLLEIAERHPEVLLETMTRAR